MTRPFRGLLASAVMLAGLGVDLTPPPREPEPPQDEFEALQAQLRDAGVDPEALLARAGDDRSEFARLGGIELAARDLAAAGVRDVDSNRDTLDRLTQAPYGVKLDLLSRLSLPKAGTERALRLGGDRSATLGTLEVRGRRGPGLQLRQERERVGEPLRILAAYTGLSVVELGEIERGLRVPTPEQWAALQVALPELGEMEAAPMLQERLPVLPAGITAAPAVQRLVEEHARAEREAERRRVEAFLHPNGRCVCFGEGTCRWCTETARKEAEEEAVEKARAATQAARRQRRPEQAKQQKAKARKTKRRGW